VKRLEKKEKEKKWVREGEWGREERIRVRK